MATSGSARLDEIAASADEMLTLYELAGSLAGQASISDTGDIIGKHLRRLVPFSLCIFYLYDSSTDELEAKHAIGDATSVVKGLRVPVGQRLSGWVAANRQTIINSDPTLDLGEVARCLSPRLRSCLSTPLAVNDVLVGVLSLYSCSPEGFTEDHQRIIEAVARQIGHTLKSAKEFDGAGKRDVLTGLPNVKHLEDLIKSGSSRILSPVSLILIDIVDLKHINVRHGRSTGDEVLRHVVKHTRAALRVADILFRSASDELYALLIDTNTATAAAVASRVRHNVMEQPILLRGGKLLVDVTVTFVSAPVDGQSLGDLMAVVHSRLAPRPSAPNTIIH